MRWKARNSICEGEKDLKRGRNGRNPTGLVWCEEYGTKLQEERGGEKTFQKLNQVESRRCQEKQTKKLSGSWNSMKWSTGSEPKLFPSQRIQNWHLYSKIWARVISSIKGVKRLDLERFIGIETNEFLENTWMFTLNLTRIVVTITSHPEFPSNTPT